VAGAAESALPPLVVGLEPSVVSLHPGDETLLQVVVQGISGSYRLPLALSFDSRRVRVVEVLPAPGVDFLRSEVHESDGWIDLDMVVTDGIDGGHGVAALKVQAIEGGPAPVVLTSAGAVTSDGVHIPVAANDGALFVNAYGQVREQP
jgi:hypothetical protein